MPKDKAATNARIVSAMREEFLAFGYEKASLNRIAQKVGITAAALYRHFASKEDMFAALVQETLDDLQNMQFAEMARLEGNATDYDPFREAFSEALLDFFFDHAEGVKLLVCCSAGSRYASFEEDLIRNEEESCKQYAALLAQSGKKVKPLSDLQWHMLATEYIHLVLEIVRHDLDWEEARQHMRFVREMLFPGWKIIFGL